MRREIREARPDFEAKIEHLGFSFHTVDGQPYWNEEAAYVFQASEISELEKSTNELSERCLEAVEWVISRGEFHRLGIPEVAHRAIKEAWDKDPPAIYGRFDLVYDGLKPPKLLEYNADTPTSLLEAAVIQWHWLQEIAPAMDQFNSIWEGLVGKWTALKDEGYFKSGRVHFGCVDVLEDQMTTAVMADTAQESGLEVVLLHMHEIGWDREDRRFVDKDYKPIDTLFKLYPWEWILKDEFGPFALESLSTTHWIEPIWKMVLSNKGILPILWELFPDHPNLLPAYFERPSDMKEFVKKPRLGREGANITISTGGKTIHIPGPYEESGYVYQEYCPLPQFGENHTLIGSWVIDCEARGIGIRESNGPITEDLARFVPHYFEPQ